MLPTNAFVRTGGTGSRVMEVVVERLPVVRFTACDF
jgi:hypothetical protein